MKKDEAEKLVKKVFENPYDKTNFSQLIDDILEEKEGADTTIDVSSEEKIKSCNYLCKNEALYLGVFIVELEKSHSLFRARTLQRNFIVKQLKTFELSNALVAFYSDDENQWRFSYVKLDYKLDKNNKPKEEILPAKRYSFLVGTQNSRTACQQITKLLQRETKTEDALMEAFQVEALNKEFYNEIFKWYEKALQKVTFPNDEKVNEHNKINLIRLLTRLLFVWFIKEKKLINEDLFNKNKLKNIIDWNKPSSFYKAILQNLFFATLNREISKRSFRTSPKGKPNSNNYSVTNIYRYEDYFLIKGQAKIKKLFEQTPFLNGGLFDCLDRDANQQEIKAYQKEKSIRQEKKLIRIDGFSDRPTNELVFPNDLFFSDDEEEGLIDILGKYQFTIEESTPIDIDVALDPELLGKIFENLLASYNPETQEQARKSSGSFYTPKPIVNYMVNESLKLYFKQQVSPTDNDKDFFNERLDDLFFVTEQTGENKKGDEPLIYKEEIPLFIKAINKLKVLDPAVGSGAFAMGLLQKLITLLNALDPNNTYWKKEQLKVIDQLTDQESKKKVKEEIEKVFAKGNEYNDYSRKLYLIENVIYGVDIQPIAIQISKLRFFISLVVGQQPNKSKEDNYGIKALPNLETKFISANTLLRLNLEDQKQNLFFTMKIEEHQKKLQEIRHNYFNAKTLPTKRKYRQEDLEVREDIAKALKTMGDVPDKEAKKIAFWDPYNQNTSSDWFNLQWQFGLNKGFDIVIGNPPYIQLQKNSGRLAELYKDEKYESFARAGDISCLFYELGNQILHDKGHLAFITSNKWMRAGYGEKLRNYFSENTNPKILIDLGPGVFENATVDTNILIFQKTTQKPKEINCLSTSVKQKLNNISLENYIAKNTINLSKFSKETWAILSPIEQQIKEKIERIGTPLKDWDISINYGIKTGYNPAFIIDGETKDKLIAQDSKSAEIIRPILRGKDIKRYSAQFADKWLIVTFPSKNYDIDKFPAIKRFLKGFQSKLNQTGQIITEEEKNSIRKHLNDWGISFTEKDLKKSRKKTNNKWFETQDSISYWSDFFKPKIVWSEMTKKNCFIWEEKGILTNQTCYFITDVSKELLAILNSKTIFWYFTKCLGADLGTGAFRWIKQYVEKIPIPEITPAEQKPFIDLVDKILEITSHKNYDPSNPPVEQKELESQIDELVLDLYQFNQEEKEFIRNN